MVTLNHLSHRVVGFIRSDPYAPYSVSDIVPSTTESYQRMGNSTRLRILIALAARANSEEETPAQAEARARASMEIKMESFSVIWRLLGVFGLKMRNSE